MSTVEQNLEVYCQQVAAAARDASVQLQRVPTEVRNNWLIESARQIRDRCDEIVAANACDIAKAPEYGLDEAQVDRLRLDADRIEGIAAGMEVVAGLPDPVGEVIETTVRPNGLKISRIRVPLGVVFFIYESRPNVTADAAAICLKSGNAVILRGGKEAAHSSRAIVDILAQVAASQGMPPQAVQLVETSDRDAVGHFLGLNKYIDLAIPRGGEGLIRRVAEEATMPVIKHFSGNCHVYVDQAADLAMAESIVINSKCQRQGVCNACESLLVHEAVADEFVPRAATALQDEGIEIRGDERTCQLVPEATRAGDDDYFTEYLGPIIAVRVVDSLQQAIDHINHYGSHHTDAIVSGDEAASSDFLAQVDSAAVMVNASTRFNDGAEFGLGAEIGISTDKFHARGPCGLKELTTYKYTCIGNGQVRN
jgi:glutamate-5-semialdehyde dehydrogenase